MAPAWVAGLGVAANAARGHRPGQVLVSSTQETRPLGITDFPCSFLNRTSQHQAEHELVGLKEPAAHLRKSIIRRDTNWGVPVLGEPGE